MLSQKMDCALMKKKKQLSTAFNVAQVVTAWYKTKKYIAINISHNRLQLNVL